MIMRNLDTGHHTNMEVGISVGRNPPIAFHFKSGFLSGTFYTDLESAIALRFELENAIKIVEGRK